MEQEHGTAYSPDGRWRWDGRRWVAVAPGPARRSSWLVLACSCAAAAGLLAATTAGALAGPALFQAVGSAVAGLRSAPPASSSSSSDAHLLDVAAPPGAQAIPSADATAPAAGGAVDLKAIAASVGPATVLIDARLPHESYDSAGTGIVLSASGLVLTDEHVVNGADSISAQIGGTGRTYQAALVGVDLGQDVALLQLEHASGLAVASLGRSAAVAVGDRIAVVGYGHDAAPDVVPGTIDGLSESVDVTDPPSQRGASNESKVSYDGMLHSDAHSLEGQSGGPVIDGAGRAVGMDQVGSDADDYDIPIDRALAAARDIAAGHAGADVLIGRPADLGLVARTRPGSSGARVQTVFSGSPAEGLGIQQGDVITAIDGSAIASAVELRQVLARYHPGDRVTLRWTDSGAQNHAVRVTLAAGTAP